MLYDQASVKQRWATEFSKKGSVEEAGGSNGGGGGGGDTTSSEEEGGKATPLAAPKPQKITQQKQELLEKRLAKRFLRAGGMLGRTLRKEIAAGFTYGHVQEFKLDEQHNISFKLVYSNGIEEWSDFKEAQSYLILGGVEYESSSDDRDYKSCDSDGDEVEFSC
mmetsp:Transcript_26039/g.47489  ORF Transcript_26039/g.47489 Transcript_26039/m.47489 type:complete len:164 (+) Transcript_26039:3-494(+)